ncbi:class I SAM-dependent methyltransferase, partial [Alphaproteobacteria bacterium]|nr:class I SAM-dependent methyltransferase [Alphaproteobacteria bacterium]
MIINKINREIFKKFYKIGYFMVFFFKPISSLNNKIEASKESYLRLWKNTKSEQFPEVDKYEKMTGFKIDDKWYHELALHTQVVKKKSKLNYAHGRLLYSTLRKYIEDLKENNKIPHLRIIETGTARGFSSLCMAKALNDSSCEGNIITLDVIPNNTKLYWNCIDDHEGKKTRLELLSKWSFLVNRFITFIEGDSANELRKISIDRINFAFLDGSHTYKDVISEFNHIKKQQLSGDIIFFDDYNKEKFPGIVKAVDKICSEENYNKQKFFSSHERGYVIAKKK